MPEILEDITVLDFSWGWAGSLATMVMSDFGADVIKVEPPGGDPFRAWPQSLMWNRGKRSVVLDLKTPGGRSEAQRMAGRADVVVESFRPWVADRMGIGYDALRAERPDLVYCSITGFGPKGPYANYKGYEGVVAAKCGRMMALAGLPQREGPVFAAVNVANHAAGMAAVRGIVAALYVRDRSGLGQKVETSLLQGISYYDMYQWLIWQMMVKDPEHFPEDPASDRFRPQNVGYVPVRTRDGRWLQMANIVARPFRASMEAIGLGWIFQDPRFETAPILATENRELLRDMILQRMQEKSLEEWMDLFVNEARDVAAEPFMTSQEGIDHLQIRHNGHIQEVQDPRVGPMLQLGTLARFSETPGSIKGPAPEPGQHNKEVLNLQRDINGTNTQNRGGPAPQQPLEGTLVLDFSTVIAGPLTGSMLAELGARIIRVETLDGDYMRINFHGLAINRTMAGTESISIDLKTPEGQKIIQALVARVDLILHNMRPGAPERLGIGYQQVRKINPNILYLYVGGYGDNGPYSHRPAMHPIGGAVSGGALAQAGRGALPPTDVSMTLEEIRELSRRLGRANETNPDPNTSMVTCTAAVLGLYARQRFGVGQSLQTTMIGANAYANADDFFSYQGKPPRLIMDADGYGLTALYRLYQAQDGWVFLACLFEEEWHSLCKVIGRPDLPEDPRFADAEARQRNDEVLVRELQKAFSSKPALEWEKLLTEADVACVKAEDRGLYHFFSEDPHVAENGLTVEVESLKIGRYWRHAPILSFSLTPCKVGPGVMKGQHTRSVLRELGYSDERIDELRASGVVDWEEVSQ